MKLEFLGLQMSLTKAIPQNLQAVWDRGWVRILESWTGAWQHNDEITVGNVTTHPAVFACTTLIQNDIAKMRLRLVQEDADGIWAEIESPAFTPVLTKPNHFENRIQFIASWINSKLLYGNTYALKVRDARRVVRSLYVLDATRVRPLVSESGDVFYELKRDDLGQLPQDMYTVPASEIIHDRWNCLFHPLVGLSPIYACGLAAVQGLNIQNSATTFFGNGSNPGGVIEVPGDIGQEVANRVKTAWDTGFSGDNAGKVAVLANGMKYVQMKISAVDSQVVEQLKWTAETICSVYHVPSDMAGFGPATSFNNVEAKNQQYYSQCLQILIESVELCLDDGLGLTVGENAANRYGTEFDLDDLLRLDSDMLVGVLEKGRNYFTPNEGRRRLNLKPVEGGNVLLRQQQEFSLQAIHKRDAKPDPFSTDPQSPPPEAPAEPDPEPDGDDVKALHLMAARMQAGNWATKCLQS